MKDIEGNQLQVGQIVVFTWDRDSEIYKGEVIGFTKLKVKVMYKWRNSTTNSESLKYPRNLLIINDC